MTSRTRTVKTGRSSLQSVTRTSFTRTRQLLAPRPSPLPLPAVIRRAHRRLYERDASRIPCRRTCHRRNKQAALNLPPEKTSVAGGMSVATSRPAHETPLPEAQALQRAGSSISPPNSLSQCARAPRRGGGSPHIPSPHRRVPPVRQSAGARMPRQLSASLTLCGRAHRRLDEEAALRLPPIVPGAQAPRQRGSSLPSLPQYLRRWAPERQGKQSALVLPTNRL